VRILLSNDDGYFAPGIAILAETLSGLASVIVVAPERDRSGASNSLTLDRPLSVRTSANGPVQRHTHRLRSIPAVLIAEEMPDMIISGINLGANMGDDTIYSGTVAAAIEAPSPSASVVRSCLASKAGEHYDTAARRASW
jgi:5'-nucleotidase